MDEKQKTKICISCEGDTIDSFVDHRFSRCQYFLMVDPQTKDYSAAINSSAAETGDVGLVAAQQVIEADVGVVITGSIDDGALSAFIEAGVKVFPGVFSKTGQEALQAYEKGELAETKTANA